ncbi:hypothetical protein JCM11251_000972 [Rhodosporidiobolus azoricus]
MQEFSYDALNEEILGFEPSPVFQPPVQPQPQRSPYQSGYSTPNRGRGRGRGGFTPGGGSGRGGSGSGTSSPHSGFGGSAGRGRGRGGGIGAGAAAGHGGFSPFNARGRGRGGSFSGAATPRGGGVVGMGGRGEIFNPLLVPVKFVKASSAGLGTVGGEDDHSLEKAGAEAPKPWQLRPFEEGDKENSGIDGALADGVQKLGLDGRGDTLSPTVEDVEHFEPTPETTATMAVDEIEDAHPGDVPTGHPGIGSHHHPVLTATPSPPPSATESGESPPTMGTAGPPSPTADDDEAPVFEISTIRSEIHIDLAASLPPPPALAAHALDLIVQVDDGSESEDEDSDDEQILYPARAVSHADPVPAPRPPPAAPSSLPSSTLEVLQSTPTASSGSPRAPPPPAQTKQNKKALKRASRAARKAGRQHARSGNAHLFAAAEKDREEQVLGGLDDEEEDEEDVQDREDGKALFRRLQGGGAMTVDDMLPANADDEEEDETGVGAIPITLNDHEDGQPRLNDSDIDWGSDAPPAQKPRGSKAKRDLQRQQRADQREVEKLERLVSAGATREEIELGLAMERSLREDRERKEEKEKRRRERRQREERMAEEDYLAQLAAEGGDDGDDTVAAMRAFAKGVAGSLGGVHERGDDLDLRAAEEMEEDEDEWGTSSGSETEEGSSDEGSSEIDDEEAYRRGLDLEEEDSDEVDSDVELELDYSLGDADGRVEHSLSLASTSGENTSFDSSLSSSTDSAVEDYEFEKALLSGGTVRLQSIGQGGGGGKKAERERKKERIRARKGKGKALEMDEDDDSEEDSDEDGDEQLFRGKNTWADDDEAFIRRMQRTVAINADVLQTAQGGRAARRANRKERNKLFKAISEGNFDDFDGGEEMDDLDEEIEQMLMDDEDAMAGWGGAGPSKKQRKKDKTFNGAFSAQLAATWDKDRQKKAGKKAERAAIRASALEAETRDASRFSHSKSAKKAAKAAAAHAEFDNDAATVNARIRHFITIDISSSSLSLPPMSKKSRIAVHLLAEVYGLKSRSIGSGKNRFPVLERTQRTTISGVSERRVRAIVGTADGEEELGGRGGWDRPRGGKMAGLWKAMEAADRHGGGKGGGKRGGGGGGGRNSEGAVVGQGADRIGAENIGFALLKKMGWTEGAQIGSSQTGLLEPIAARVKTTKQGLGSGYAVNRREAQAMARAPERDWDE